MAAANEHSFVRWEEPGGERFNIESTCEGFGVRPDEYYHKWPVPIPQEALDKNLLLCNLKPRHELAHHLVSRVRCLRDNLQLSDAIRVAYHAAKVAPYDLTAQTCHAAISMMYMASSGLATYEFKPGTDRLAGVTTDDGSRDPEQWEARLAPKVLDDYRRVLSLNDIDHGKFTKQHLYTQISTDQLFQSDASDWNWDYTPPRLPGNGKRKRF